MKTFFKILLYILIIALVSGAVIGTYIFLERPLEEAAVVIAIIFGLWLTIVVIRKLIIRYRAKAQVKRILQEEEADRDISDVMTPQELLREMRQSWKQVIGALKRSHLKLRGDPLYVLPWFMVIGKPRSGKSSSLRNAKLLSPEINLPDHDKGSTLNLDWWLYEQAIVIDTAGRYAVPDERQRDRKEWTALLGMLSKHKQKEPVNGLVLVIAADRLLGNSEEQLLDEGRKVRASIHELMEKLEIHVPVYMMVTKCDLVEGFAAWCKYLPEKALAQGMGYLVPDDQEGSVDHVLDESLDSVLDRIKELRLLMLERSHIHDDALLTLPRNMEKLRAGMHHFINGALKENPYQDAPIFRGVYFSTSQQAIDPESPAQLSDKGIFLHDIYTKILPTDRGLLETLPSSERLRRAFRTLALSLGGGITLFALAALTTAFTNDLAELNELTDRVTKDLAELKEISDSNSASAIPDVMTLSELRQLPKISHSSVGFNLNQRDINEQFKTLNLLHKMIKELQQAQAGWVIPWQGKFGESEQLSELVKKYNEAFRDTVLEHLDSPLKNRVANMKGEGTSKLVGGLIRRINLLKTAMDLEKIDGIDDKPKVSEEYILVMDYGITGDAAEMFNQLYISYLVWSQSSNFLKEEKNTLQAHLVRLIERNEGDYSWVIEWANAQGNQPVRIDDFWSGTISLTDGPMISSAYTLEGRNFINSFLAELAEADDKKTGSQAGDDSAGHALDARKSRLGEIKTEFEKYYRIEYVKAWVEFAERFDEGMGQLRDRKEWVFAVEQLATPDNPYFRLLERMEEQLKPIEPLEYFPAYKLVAYFKEMQSFAKKEGGDSSKLMKKVLKVVGKAGKAGKLVASAGKKGLKAKKKMGGKDISGLIEIAAKELDAYKKGINDTAFNIESLEQSNATLATFFTPPYDPGAGDGAAAIAFKSVSNVQKLIDASRPPGTRLFWNLYKGPLKVFHDYMEKDTGCYLQDQWDTTVLAEIEGVTDAKLGTTLIGDETGLVWRYIDGPAKPYLRKRSNKGYLPTRVKQRSITWNKSFLNFINKASLGRKTVGNEFTVSIKALPTGANPPTAQISPSATFLTLHCADGVQELANYNYTVSKDFKWSLENCDSASLQIDIGHIRLRKDYGSEKNRFGFSEFLKDFHDGRRVFSAKDFSASEREKLRNEGVETIDVNYKFSGHKPVVRLLTNAPLNPPDKVAMCWPDSQELKKKNEKG